MQELHEHLNSIIRDQRLSSLFQPIVALGSKAIYAYEALVRGPSDSPLHRPIDLFSAAERFQLTAELEHACRSASIRQFADQRLAQKLFVNVSPAVLLEPSFKKGRTLAILAQVGIPAERIVIEITEHQPTENYQVMRDAVRHYREMGFEIALDDLGAGYSGLRLWTELMPDYVKIDRHFIQNLDQDPVKLNFVRSIRSMAQATHCQVVAEGVETEAEYQAVAELGIDYAQGYYFARPAALAVTEVAESLFSVKKTQEVSDVFKTTTRISEIMQEIAPISPQTTNNDVLQMFQKNSQLQVIPLVENGVACGLVYKDQFLTRLFASRYGIDLYGRQPVQVLVDVTPFVFDHKVVIEDVSRQLTTSLRTDSAFIISENGCYRGIGTVKDLLQMITAQQLQNAWHANPLTQLPGITPINHVINTLLAENTRFTIGYFDLDNFKPFNDQYGYEKGDQAIRLVADLLSGCVARGTGYVGHIGGDDFIVIFTGMDWEYSCKQILNAFRSRVLSYYNKEHRLAGGINAVDRQGKLCFFPLLTLSIGIVTADVVMLCRSHIEIADLAAEAKHKAKMIRGNSYFVNRRVPGSEDENVIHMAYSTDMHDKAMG